MTLAFIFSIILFTVGKIISHRIAGPLFAFERFLNEMLDGKGLTKSGAALKLRTNDDLKHLEDKDEKVKQKLNKIHAEKNLMVTEYSEETVKIDPKENKSDF